jgi:hypothetical protein
MKKSESRVPAKGSAVVIGALSEAMRSRLAEAAQGSVTPLPDVADTHVVTAKLKDPRKLVDALNEVVGSEAVVVPVLTDKEGHVLLPTGHLQVRFKHAPDESVLSTMAKRHGLDFLQRNKWAPLQAEFAIRPDDSRYLPEITSAIEQDAGVERAWPDVRTSFKRESA